MRKALKDLTLAEHSEWFGLGPLALAVLAGLRALVSDDPFARGVWLAVAAIMLIICATVVLLARRNRVRR